MIENPVLPEFFVSTGFGGQEAPGSGISFPAFTPASNPQIIVNNIPGVVLFSSGTINVPNGTYLVKANMSAQCLSGDVSVNIASFVYAEDYTMPFSSANFGESLIIENEIYGFKQSYQNISPILWNTTANGNNMLFYQNLTYGGGAACNCFISLIITQINTPYSLSSNLKLLKNCMVDKKDVESKYRPKVKGFATPSITITDEEYISVSPQTAAISISSAKNDMSLSSKDFLD